MTTNDAYKEGHNAYWDGANVIDNPYDEETEECRSWEEGWRAARRHDYDESEGQTVPRFSVLIPARNEEKHRPGCLESIKITQSNNIIAKRSCKSCHRLPMAISISPARQLSVTL